MIQTGKKSRNTKFLARKECTFACSRFSKLAIFSQEMFEHPSYLGIERLNAIPTAAERPFIQTCLVPVVHHLFFQKKLVELSCIQGRQIGITLT